jgi:hypothetical protein
MFWYMLAVYADPEDWEIAHRPVWPPEVLPLPVPLFVQPARVVWETRSASTLGLRT